MAKSKYILWVTDAEFMKLQDLEDKCQGVTEGGAKTRFDQDAWFKGVETMVGRAPMDSISGPWLFSVSHSGEPIKPEKRWQRI